MQQHVGGGNGTQRRNRYLFLVVLLTLGALTSCVAKSPGGSSPTTSDGSSTVPRPGSDFDVNTLTLGDTKYTLSVTNCATDPVPLGSTDLDSNVQQVMRLKATASTSSGTEPAHLELFRVEGSGGNTADSFRLYEGERTKPDRSWEITGSVGPLAPREGAPQPALAQRGLLFNLGDAVVSGSFKARAVQDYQPTGDSVEIELAVSCVDD